MLCSLDIHRIQPAIPIRFAGLYSFILSFIFIANILFWRYLEEKELVKRFPGYAGYKKSTFF
jgi:protein-S-isoprenylcysteine O-methyltransferase Ste14